jgi:hypothetical protein
LRLLHGARSCGADTGTDGNVSRQAILMLLQGLMNRTHL